MSVESDLLNYHQIIKIIHKYVELSYKIYKSLIEEKYGKTILDFEGKIDSICNGFHRKNFPSKLEIISKDLKLTDTLEYLTQVNRVRNCLEYRSGIVSKADCDLSKNYMSIKFRYLKIGTAEGEMSPISNIKGRLQSKVEFTNQEKRFHVGEKIDLNFEDNTKLVYSINVCFKHIIDGVYAIKNIDQEKTPTIVREFK